MTIPAIAPPLSFFPESDFELVAGEEEDGDVPAPGLVGLGLLVVLSREPKVWSEKPPLGSFVTAPPFALPPMMLKMLECIL